MKGKSLVDRFTDVDADLANSSDGLRIALRTVLRCDYKIQDAIMNSDLLLRLADAIEYEYFPRPRWGTGEPVHVGDCYMKDDALREVTHVFARVRVDDVTILNGETFSHYARIEPDTQERIDSDSKLLGSEYVSRVLKRYKANMSSYEMQQLMVQDLLRRQRELNGRDA